MAQRTLPDIERRLKQAIADKQEALEGYRNRMDEVAAQADRCQAKLEGLTQALAIVEARPEPAQKATKEPTEKEAAAAAEKGGPKPLKMGA